MQLFSNTILAILDKIMDMNTGKFKKLCEIWLTTIWLEIQDSRFRIRDSRLKNKSIENLSILSLELMIRYDSCFFFRITLSKVLSQKINRKIFCCNFPVIFMTLAMSKMFRGSYVRILCLCYRSDADHFAV